MDASIATIALHGGRPAFYAPAITATLVRSCELCGEPFPGKRGSRFCRPCWPRRVKRRAQKYTLGERERAIFTELYDGSRGCCVATRKRLGWPRHAIYRAASELGLSRPKQADSERRWTEEEIDVLQEWTGRRSSTWIGQRLGRTRLSVVRKQQRLQMGTGIHDGYTLANVAACFGVLERTVKSWINSGKLVASVQRTEREHDIFRISDEALKEFIKRHPGAYLLHRVDQLWFLGFTLGDLGAREEREGMPAAEKNKGGKPKRGLSMRAEGDGASLGAGPRRRGVTAEFIELAESGK